MTWQRFKANAGTVAFVAGVTAVIGLSIGIEGLDLDSAVSQGSLIVLLLMGVALGCVTVVGVAVVVFVRREFSRWDVLAGVAGFLVLPVIAIQILLYVSFWDDHASAHGVHSGEEAVHGAIAAEAPYDRSSRYDRGGVLDQVADDLGWRNRVGLFGAVADGNVDIESIVDRYLTLAVSDLTLELFTAWDVSTGSCIITTETGHHPVDHSSAIEFISKDGEPTFADRFDSIGRFGEVACQARVRFLDAPPDPIGGTVAITALDDATLSWTVEVEHVSFSIVDGNELLSIDVSTPPPQRSR